MALFTKETDATKILLSESLCSISIEELNDMHTPIVIHLEIEAFDQFDISLNDLSWTDRFRLKRQLLKEYANKDWFYINENKAKLMFISGPLSDFQKETLKQLKLLNTPVLRIEKSDNHSCLSIRKSLSPLLFLKWYSFLKTGFYCLGTLFLIFLSVLSPNIIFSWHTIDHLQAKISQMQFEKDKRTLPVELQKKAPFFSLVFNKRIQFDEQSENPIPVLEKISEVLTVPAKQISYKSEKDAFLIKIDLTENLDTREISILQRMFQHKWELIDSTANTVELSRKKDAHPK